jgi:RHS repeat-associated protein
VSGVGISVNYSYNGLGDRLSETANSQTTHYTMDLNAGLTQVLQDGTNTYLYGAGRVAQYGANGPEYYLGDALGSVRQMVDASGEVTLGRSYKPYGGVLSSIGGGATSYGFTNEWTDASTGDVYLRARWYAPGQGRFLTKDTWEGDYTRPMSLNRWNYVEGNPINRADPLGLFDTEIIENSLGGYTLEETFGSEHYGLMNYETYGVARWGLYNLLKDAKDFDRITLRYADFSIEDPNYPLASDTDGSWNVRSDCGQLLFINSKWGGWMGLDDFMTILALKSRNTDDPYLNPNNKWWRPATLQYHWYDLNGHFYSDFDNLTAMPDLIFMTGSIKILGGISYSFIQDRYGNKYEAWGIGGGAGIALAEVWEGYGSLTSNVPLSRRYAKLLNENSLRRIIEGWSLSGSISVINAGIGITFWNVGSIALFGGTNTSAGILGSISITAQGRLKR